MVTFVTNAEAIAKEAMRSVDTSLIDRYAGLIRFLATEPEAASKMRGKNKPEPGTEAYVRAQASAFAASRGMHAPEPPSTVPDQLVSFILHHYFDVPEGDLERVKVEHQKSMGAENMVGDLLERYLATVMEPNGWIWCSGSMVKAVDFIKPPSAPGLTWEVLQIKNRDNSENSSSSAIRNGTNIKKWFRTFSKKMETNWAAFPCDQTRLLVSEAKFKQFVRDYLVELKRIS